MEIKDLYKIFLESKGVSTDTRQIGAGVLFFALKGANFNGNEWISKLLFPQEGFCYHEAKNQLEIILKKLKK